MRSIAAVIKSGIDGYTKNPIHYEIDTCMEVYSNDVAKNIRYNLSFYNLIRHDYFWLKKAVQMF
ncbi:hypothetical protein GCM10008940_00040 [Microbulbifer agarilyticus]